MKIKLDENLPLRLVDALTQLGHDVDTVTAEGLSGKNDQTIWACAQEESRFLITQDLDFSDIRQFKPGAHHGLLLIRLRNPGRNAVLNRISFLFSTESVETWPKCFVIATENKIRIHRP